MVKHPLVIPTCVDQPQHVTATRGQPSARTAATPGRIGGGSPVAPRGSAVAGVNGVGDGWWLWVSTNPPTNGFIGFDRGYSH